MQCWLKVQEKHQKWNNIDILITNMSTRKTRNYIMDPHFQWRTCDEGNFEEFLHSHIRHLFSTLICLFVGWNLGEKLCPIILENKNKINPCIVENDQ